MGIETMAAVSLAGSVGSSIMGAAGASQAADAQAQSMQYKAAVARNNAIIAERNAQEATSAGVVGASTNDMKTRNTVGTQIVTQAANGLDVGSGTNAALQDSARDLGHLDSMTIIHNALKQATGFRAQGANFTAEAGLDEASAVNARTAGDYKVATSLLGGATSFGDKWSSYSRAGAFA